jgi:hypothetical protein
VVVVESIMSDHVDVFDRGCHRGSDNKFRTSP